MTNPDIERRALALYERLSERPRTPRYRERLLARESQAVLARVAALERGGARGSAAMPTELAADTVAAATQPPPSQAGAFALTDLLGEGGMGQVWKGARNDGLFEQVCAVKLVHPHLARLAGGRFAEERRILARLEHPNIARLIDGGVLESGAPYLVMEFVDGRPIDAVAQALEVRARVDLFLQAADAVQFAHERLIVHADLKPSNMLVDAAGRVKLLDFGIARLLGEEHDGGALPMTRDYASPARLGGAAPVVADDVFALGLVLRGLIAGGGADADLTAVANKARAVDEPGRYGSVAALIADLRRWREGFPVEAQPQGTAYRARKFVDRHRLGVAMTAAAILALSLTSVVATVSYVRAERARAEARARFDDVRGTARYLLFDLSDRLERQPQSLALRAEVARVSQSYLDRLAGAEEAPAAVRLESAQGLLRLAERQGKPGRANLGQAEQAKRNLSKAYDLARAMPGPDGRRLAAQVRLDQARLAATVDNDLPTGERMIADARSLIFDAAAPLRDLEGGWFQELSNLRQWQGRYAEAIAAARRGLAAPAPADPRDAAVRQAGLEDLLAEGLYYSGRPDLAEAPYRARVSLLEAALRRWPSDPQIMRQLPRARWALGTTLLELERPAQALPILQTAAAEGRALAAFDRADTDAARSAGVSANAVAQTLAALGRRDEAIQVLSRGAEERRLLWRALPTETMRARDYAITLSMLADVEAMDGRLSEACAHYDQVEQAFADLRRAGRATALDDDSTLKMSRAHRAQRCG